MTTAVDGQQQCYVYNKDDCCDDEMVIWNRIVRLRMQESAELRITSLLLQQYGNRIVPGNTHPILDEGTEEDITDVRQMQLGQLLLHHIGIMTNTSSTTHGPYTAQERLTSWMLLQDIFNKIDEVKESHHFTQSSIDGVEESNIHNRFKDNIGVAGNVKNSPKKANIGLSTSSRKKKELPKDVGLNRSPSIPRKRKRPLKGTAVAVLVPIEKKSQSEKKKKTNSTNKTIKKVTARTNNEAESVERNIQQEIQNHRDSAEGNSSSMETRKLNKQSQPFKLVGTGKGASHENSKSNDEEGPIKKKIRPMMSTNDEQPIFTSLLQTTLTAHANFPPTRSTVVNPQISSPIIPRKKASQAAFKKKDIGNKDTNTTINAPSSNSTSNRKKVTNNTCHETINKSSQPSRLGLNHYKPPDTHKDREAHNITDKEDEYVKKSMRFLSSVRSNNRLVWTCHVCIVNGIKDHNLPRHCNNSQHKYLLDKRLCMDSENGASCCWDDTIMKKSEQFLSCVHNAHDLVWTCHLCSVDKILDKNLLQHCNTDKHKHFLEKKASEESNVNNATSKLAGPQIDCRNYSDINRTSCVNHPNDEKNMAQGEQIITSTTSRKSDKSEVAPFQIESCATKVLCTDVPILNPISFVVKADSSEHSRKTGLSIFAKTYKPRTMSCSVKFICSEIKSQCLKEVLHRLQEWDPFWIVKSVICVGRTHTIQSTSPHTEFIQTAAQHYVPNNLQSKYIVTKAVEGSWTNGDSVLQFKMLPELYVPEKETKRADCHLWPKGTFIQINDVPCKINQRKQSAPPYDKEWKGMCEPLSINNYLSSASELNCIQICCADSTKYYYALLYSEYRDSNALLTRMLDVQCAEQITKLSFETSLARAKVFANQQMSISLDSDDDDGAGNVDEMGKFVFSLTCPISRTLMVTPVRGKHCKHFQCFDLQNYIDTNVHVSGSRWRCASCEKFISIQNLEICGFTAHLLEQYKDVANSECDRIELRSNGQYKLLRQQVSRHKKVLNSTSISTTSGNIVVEEMMKQVVEVID